MSDLDEPVNGEGPARSLVEAHVYLDLVASGAEGGAAAERAVLAEEEEGWLVRLDDTEVFVPYAAEAEAREADATFGTGVSELIDPGQWMLLAATYARRALEAAMHYAADPSSGQYDEVVADWRFAADAVEEALKWLPDGAGELPPESFQSEMGRAAFEREPERFTRATMDDDLAYYRAALGDFLRLHG
jgi:hypothetical protein